MREGWRRAGLQEGDRVIDLGAGPGYVTRDLARAVGPGGHVLAVERSPQFVRVNRERCREEGLANVEVLQADLTDASLLESAYPGTFDIAWCRWVASFVSSVEALARLISRALKPGGVLVSHEYIAYETWKVVPPRPHLEWFVTRVMESWRASGGEPNVAGPFSEALLAEGLTVECTRPIVFSAAPGESEWQWPASFVEINLDRLQELGRVSPDQAGAVRRDLRAAEAEPSSRMVTPLVLEIVARRS